MSIPANRDNYIIELAGLPGSGKSTICNLLSERLGVSRLVFVNKYNCSRHKLLVSLPFLPLAVGKFHRILRKLMQMETTGHQGPGPLISGQPNPSGSNGFAGKSRSRTILSILSVLNGFALEYRLAALEAAIRRKLMVLDGGFVQHGISVWLRSPREIRDDLWCTYLSLMPSAILCIVLQCAPAEALRRSKSRPQGVPPVFSRKSSATPDEGWLMDEYQQMSELLISEALTARVKCIYVNSEMDADRIADLILAEVDGIIPLKDLIVQ